MGILRLLGTTAERQGVVSSRYRGKRFAMFESLARRFSSPVRVLDVGGTEQYWKQMGVQDGRRYQVTLLNLEKADTTLDGFKSVEGDACRLSDLDPSQYDVVYSNSVIEHVFTFQNQKAMADGIRSFGKPYWLQTPNYWFPSEPHYHWLGWQWYPRWLRIALIRRIRCGMRGPESDPAAAARLVDEVRLMTARELAGCFPEATLFRERIGPLVKSLVVYHGF